MRFGPKYLPPVVGRVIPCIADVGLLYYLLHLPQKRAIDLTQNAIWGGVGLSSGVSV